MTRIHSCLVDISDFDKTGMSSSPLPLRYPFQPTNQTSRHGLHPHQIKLIATAFIRTIPKCLCGVLLEGVSEAWLGLPHGFPTESIHFHSIVHLPVSGKVLNSCLPAPSIQTLCTDILSSILGRFGSLSPLLLRSLVTVHNNQSHISVRKDRSLALGWATVIASPLPCYPCPAYIAINNCRHSGSRPSVVVGLTLALVLLRTVEGSLVPVCGLFMLSKNCP